PGTSSAGTSSAGTSSAGAPAAAASTAAAALSECGRRAQHQDRGRRRTAKEFRHVPSLSFLSDRPGVAARDATAALGKPFPADAIRLFVQSNRGDVQMDTVTSARNPKRNR
ncbi:hypothetical protein, partial [Methylorubrum extorquens]|uniref:hypothetical protein n=1 Tax=Methylorubrum extorquens TaxID=408 RepID=UPI002FEE2FDE